MTYNPTDTNDDGTVDADVDNTNTTTQTLDTDNATVTDLKTEVENPQTGLVQAFGTWYQNTTDYPLFISVVIEATDGNQINARMSINDSQSINGLAQLNSGDGTGKQIETFTGVVPPNNYIQIEDFDNASITNTYQQRLGVA